MKTKSLLISLLLTAACVAVCSAIAVLPASAKDKDSEKESEVSGSIHVTGHPKPAELASLAKISFNDALKAAQTKVAGSVIKAKLEAEHGSLMYSFKIVGADQTVTEVEIDAGNGQVLDVDKD